jgi:hypothetical protein
LPDEAIDCFWTNVLSRPPATGWLTDVYAYARGSYERFRHAQHWNQTFQSSSDPDIYRSAWALLLASTDERLFLRDQRPSEELLASWPWRKQHQWTWGWSAVPSAVKKRKEDLANLFLGTKPPLSNQSPRRR